MISLLKGPFQTLFLSLIAVASLALLHLNLSVPLTKYLGFAPVQWGEGCTFGSALPLPESESSYALSKSGRCVSSAFLVQSKRGEVELATSKEIAEKKTVALLVLDDSGISGENKKEEPLLLELPERVEGTIKAEKWMTLSFQIPEHLVGQSIRLSLRRDGSGEGWILVRGRVNFLSSPLREEGFLSALAGLKKTPLPLFFLFLFAASTLGLLLGASKKGILLAFLLLGPGVHFRFTPSYYFDEWDLLSRFFDEGFLTVVRPHGEHFLPAFLFTFFTQVTLFGERYIALLFVSHVVHLLNVWVFFLLLHHLFGEQQRRGFLLLAGVYCVNGANSEVLQFGITQSILFSSSTLLLALFWGVHFVRSGKWRVGVCSVFAGTISPLFFAGGYFVVPFLVFILFFTLWPAASRPQADERRFSERKRAVALTFSLGAGIAAVLFAHLRIISPPSNLPTLSDFVKYVLTGSQVGTVLRTFGMIPSPNLLVIHRGAWHSVAQFFSPTGDPLVVLSLFISLFSVSFLILTALCRSRRELILAVLASLLLPLCFTLQALARWQLGLHQSLALRYQNLAIVPFLWSIAPLVFALSATRWRKCAGVLATFVFASHVSLAFDYQDFERSGVVSLSWFEKQREAHSQKLDDALLPMLPADEVANFKPERLYSSLERLRELSERENF